MKKRTGKMKKSTKAFRTHDEDLVAGARESEELRESSKQVRTVVVPVDLSRQGQEQKLKGKFAPKWWASRLLMQVVCGQLEKQREDGGLKPIEALIGEVLPFQNHLDAIKGNELRLRTNKGYAISVVVVIDRVSK